MVTVENETTLPPNRLLYSIPEVAALLHCSPNMVRKLIREEDWDLVRIGSAVRIRHNDLARFLENGGSERSVHGT